MRDRIAMLDTFVVPTRDDLPSTGQSGPNRDPALAETLLRGLVRRLERWVRNGEG